MRGGQVERRLAAILTADVVGYSRLIGADEEGTLGVLRTLRQEVIDPKIAEHRGRIVKTTGDGLLVEFKSVVDALRCASQVQAAMAERNTSVSAAERIEFRIGVHQGDIVVEDGDIFGDGVNVAARLEGLAEPGGICVSRRVQEDVEGKLDLAFEDLGDQQLKNIARPVRVYRVGPYNLRPARPQQSHTGGDGQTFSNAAEATPLSLPDRPSIAVLPFQNLSGDATQEYFTDGMVEEIITALSHIRWLFVIARNSSFTYKGRTVDVRQVARDLGVRYVLEGSVRKAADRVRITGQLIDTVGGTHIWADRFDGALDDVFELQDLVASRIAGAIEPRLRLAEVERASRKLVGNFDAYDLYLRGLAQHYKFTRESVREAIALLRQTLLAAPGYPPAEAMLGRCRIGQRAQGWGPISEQEIAEVVQLAMHAIETAKDDSGTLAEAAFTLSALGGDHAAAATAIDRALVFNPNSADAWTYRGWVACYQNDAGRALDAFGRAMRLSPLDPRAWHFSAGEALAHMIAGQYEKAAEAADRSLSFLPRFGPALRTKIAACVAMGRIAEARSLLARMNDLQPGWTLAKFKANMEKNFPPDVLAAYIDGLRKVGMPED